MKKEVRTMRSYKSIVMALAFVLAAFTGVYALEQRIPLTPEQKWETVKGELVLSDYTGSVDDEREVRVFASGLEPNSFYSVWLSGGRYEDLKGLGIDEFAFKTDADGNGTFVTSMSEYVLYDWDSVQIARHLDNDPKNIENTEIVLTGDLELIK